LLLVLRVLRCANLLRRCLSQRSVLLRLRLLQCSLLREGLSMNRRKGAFAALVTIGFLPVVAGAQQAHCPL
jgi:hypothetical protein